MEKLIHALEICHETCSKKDFLSTGYPELDSLTGGLRRGDLSVIASRPSIGKTAFALNIVRNMALVPENPPCIVFFSIEMTAKQIAERLLRLESGVTEKVFQNLNQNNTTRISDAVSRFADAKIFIDPSGGISMDEIREQCLNLHQKHKIDIIVIDYLQLIRRKFQADIQQQFSEIIQELKQLACELNVSVLLLVQLRRLSGEMTEMPLEELFGEAKGVVQFANVIVLLHRERKDGVKRKALAIVAQATNGQNGVVAMQFDPENQKFEIADTCENYNENEKEKDA